MVLKPIKIRNNKIYLSFLVFILTFLIYLYLAVQSGKLYNPPEVGDAHDYDSMALQLSKGKGFSHNWDDPEFKQTYENNPEYNFLFDRNGEYLTTYKPPLYPLIISIIYSIFGRNFEFVRLFNLFCLSLSCTIFFYIIIIKFNLYCGGIFIILFTSYQKFFNTAMTIMTETIAILLISILLLSVIIFIEKNNIKSLIGISLSLSFLVLNRTIFILWFFLIIFLILFFSKKIKYAVLISIICLIIILPWMIRNILLLDSIKPFGTQSDINLPIAYSDPIIENLGEWDASIRQKIPQTFVNSKFGLEAEIANAKLSKSVAFNWIKNNINKLPLLFYLKIVHSWKPQNNLILIIYLFSFLGIILSSNKKEIFIFLSFLILNSLTIGLTWSASDNRFLVPVFPIILILASIGIYHFFGLIKILSNPLHHKFNCTNNL